MIKFDWIFQGLKKHEKYVNCATKRENMMNSLFVSLLKNILFFFDGVRTIYYSRVLPDIKTMIF